MSVHVTGDRTLQTARAVADSIGDLRTSVAAYPAEAVPDVTVIRDVVEQLRCGFQGLPEALGGLEKRLEALVLAGEVRPKVGPVEGTGTTLLESRMLVRTIIESAVVAADALEQRLAALRNVVGDLEPGGAQ